MAKPPSKAAQKAQQVLELRRMGLTFAEIAARVGYANKGAAHKAYHRAMTDAGTLDLPMTERRMLELDRLERMHAAIWPAAARGDLAAVREAKRLHDARVRLLGMSIAAGAGQRDEDLDHDGGNVVGPDRLDEMRARRAKDAADRAAGRRD